MSVPVSGGYIGQDNIDLTGVTSAAIKIGWNKPPKYATTLEMHLDAPDGEKIGQIVLKPGSKGDIKLPIGQGTLLKFDVSVVDKKLHTLFVVSKPLNVSEVATIALQSIEFISK